MKTRKMSNLLFFALFMLLCLQSHAGSVNNLEIYYCNSANGTIQTITKIGVWEIVAMTDGASCHLTTKGNYFDHYHWNVSYPISSGGQTTITAGMVDWAGDQMVTAGTIWQRVGNSNFQKNCWAYCINANTPLGTTFDGGYKYYTDSGYSPATQVIQIESGQMVSYKDHHHAFMLTQECSPDQYLYSYKHISTEKQGYFGVYQYTWNDNGGLGVAMGDCYIWVTT